MFRPVKGYAPCACPRHLLAIRWNRPPTTRYQSMPRLLIHSRRASPCSSVRRGGMGDVFRCGDDALARDLAIKIIKAEMLRCAAAAEECFCREARVTRELHIPASCPFISLGQLADGRPLLHHETGARPHPRRHAPAIAGRPEYLPRLLAVFEKVCQADGLRPQQACPSPRFEAGQRHGGDSAKCRSWIGDWPRNCRVRAGAPVEATEVVETAAWEQEAAGLSRAGRRGAWRLTCLRSRRPAIGTLWMSGPTCLLWAPSCARC